MKKPQEVPAALDKITDVVLNYHPKPKKRKKAKKRKSKKRASSRSN